MVYSGQRYRQGRGKNQGQEAGRGLSTQAKAQGRRQKRGQKTGRVQGTGRQGTRQKANQGEAHVATVSKTQKHRQTHVAKGSKQFTKIEKTHVAKNVQKAVTNIGKSSRGKRFKHFTKTENSRSKKCPEGSIQT